MQAGFEEHYQFLLGTLETLKQDPVNPCLVSKNILNLFIYEKKSHAFISGPLCENYYSSMKFSTFYI